jgi:hypothetical protein
VSSPASRVVSFGPVVMGFVMFGNSEGFASAVFVSGWGGRASPGAWALACACAVAPLALGADFAAGGWTGPPGTRGPFGPGARPATPVGGE